MDQAYPTGGAAEYERRLVRSGGEAHGPGMSKRTLAAILWFFAGWVGAGGVFAMSGLPSELGMVVGAVVAALIDWDPKGWIWAKQAPARRVRPINEVAAELDRASGAPAGEAERISR